MCEALCSPYGGLEDWRSLAKRGGERSMQGDRVLFLWEGFLGVKITRSPYLWEMIRGLMLGCMSGVQLEGLQHSGAHSLCFRVRV